MDPNKDLKKDIIYHINRARTNPRDFSNVLKDYLKYFKGKVFKYPNMTPISTNEGESAVSEAITFLNNQSVLNVLKENKDMNDLAFDSLSNILKCNNFDEIEDNNDLDVLIDKYGVIEGSFAQSIEFGTSTAEMLVANLIIDDGDANRGNRNNIFKDNFKIIGVDHGTHKQFRSATVVIFCQDFISKDDQKYKEYTDSSAKDDHESKRNVKGSTKRPSKILKIDPDDIKETSTNTTSTTNSSSPEEITDNDFDDGVVKVVKEIETIVKGKKKTKIVKTIKTMKDGSIKSEEKSYDV